MTLRKIILAVLFLAVLQLGARGARAEQTADGIAAVVDGEVITLFDLNEAMKPLLARIQGQPGGIDQEQLAMLRRKLLGKLIDDILLKKETERLKVTVTDSEVEQQIRTFKKRLNLTEEQLQQQLSLERMTRKEYEHKVKDDLLRQKILMAMVRRKVVVTDEEINKYYESKSKGSSHDRRVTLGLIVLPPDVDADQLRARIDKGELTFEDAAAQYSQGPGSDKKGDLGTLGWKELSPSWRSVLDGMKPGEVSKPFDIKGQQALLKLKAEEVGGLQAPAEVREEIREILSRAKMDELFTEYMDKLRSRAIIEIKY